MTPHVWMVEIWERGRWVPVSWCRIRVEAVEERWRWHMDCPDDRFRVRKYVAVTRAKKRRRTT